MTAAASAYDLEQKGYFLDAARAIDCATGIGQELRVLRVQLENHVGLPHRARSAAQELLKQPLAAREKAICWEVIGREALLRGQVSEGLRAMKNAFVAANASHDLRVEARLQASYVESLLHQIGIETAVLEIPKLRRAALNAGDPYSFIELHSLTAEMKARQGLVAAATSNLKTARGLLEKHTNLRQQGRIAVVAAGLALIQSDYETALRHATEALECANLSGSRDLRIPALNFLAYIRLAQQQFLEARRHLDELLSDVRKGSSTEIGVRDTEMMLALAQGDMDLAASITEEISRLSSRQEEQNSYYYLWHLPNRVRWLYRKGNSDAGLSLSLLALERAQNARDKNLINRMRLLAAEGMSRTGRCAEGSALIAFAIRENPETSLEMTAERLRVAGRLSAAEDGGAALTQFKLAARILDGIGHKAAKTEVERDAAETLFARTFSLNVTKVGVLQDESHDSHGQFPGDVRPSAAQFSERIAAMIEIGSHPLILAKEGLSLFADSGAVLHGSVVATTGGQRKVVASYADTGISATLDDHSDSTRIQISNEDGRSFEIVVRPRSTAASRTTVVAIGQLIDTASRLARARRVEREQAALWPEPTAEQQLGLICASERTLDLVKTIRRVAASSVNVLLTGETGVGKELFARALHQASSRIDRTFLPFNCSTVARDLFDSQLFGHRRGAFTGAHADSAGVIRAAAGGTLFLDEIGEMAIETQPKLLRFLESGEILPLGDTKPQLVDVRVVAATNANLDQLVAEGRFREDLYYRLNVIRIQIPPLRERREEIPALVEHFLERFGREMQKPMLRVADETLEYLVLYRWPGNVRQLANELRRMVALAEPGAVLMPAHLSDDIAASRKTMPVDAQPRHSNEAVTRIDQPLAAAVEHIERTAIQRALALSDGRLDEAARRLGLSRKGLYLKRQRLGIH